MQNNHKWTLKNENQTTIFSACNCCRISHMYADNPSFITSFWGKTMKCQNLCFASAIVCTLIVNSAQAQLFDRGGGLIYDSVQNITWLADANYAKTSGYDADGMMNWQNAVAWVEGLGYVDSVRGTTYGDWRLPAFSDLGTPGCNYGNSGTDCGYNVATTSSELAHLYYGDFANKAILDTLGQIQLGYGIVDDPATPNDESLFSHIQSFSYWLGSSYSGDASKTWFLSTANGIQSYANKDVNFYVWAVRDGDVAAVPLPGAAWLFGASLLGWVVNRRRHPTA